MNRYFQLVKKEEDRKAILYIYGDIVSEKWLENEVTASEIVTVLADLDVDEIEVYINSYGGEVAEGLAIYNTLKQHKAKITTICNGFACSIASVIFMAGEERLMCDSSLLMIHNAWTMTAGDSQEMRKTADDLDIITTASVEAYKEHINISEEELKAMMDRESWIAPSEAIEKGFATGYIVTSDRNTISQNARKSLMEKVTREQLGIDAEEVARIVLEKMQEQIKTEEPQEKKSIFNKLKELY